MASQMQESKFNVTRHTIAAFASSSVASFMFAPFARVKLLIARKDSQVLPMRVHVETLKRAFQEEGFLSLYRGALSNFFRSGLIPAARLVSYDTFKHAMQPLFVTSAASTFTILNLTSIWCTEFLLSLLYTPQRNFINFRLNIAKAHNFEPYSLEFFKIFKNEHGLFKQYPLFMANGFVFYALLFGLFETFNNKLSNNIASTIASAIAASTCTRVATEPMNKLVQTLQVQGEINKDTLKKISRIQFKGHLIPILSTSCMLSLYTIYKQVFEKPKTIKL